MRKRHVGRHTTDATGPVRGMSFQFQKSDMLHSLKKPPRLAISDKQKRASDRSANPLKSLTGGLGFGIPLLALFVLGLQPGLLRGPQAGTPLCPTFFASMPSWH